MSGQLQSALGLATRGFRVARALPGSKKFPAGPGGFKVASDSERVVRAMFEDGRPWNVCIVPDDGVVVVDIDPRNKGCDTWAALEAEHGTVSCNMRVLSGRRDGGVHLYLRLGSGQKARKCTLGPGVDVIAAGKGHVLAPGSLHPETGTPYIYACEPAVGDPLEIAPSWLAEKLKPPPRSKRRRDLSGWKPPPGDKRTHALAEVAHRATHLANMVGERKDALFRDACRLARFHNGGLLYFESDIRPALAEAARVAGVRESEIERTLENAYAEAYREVS